LPRSVLYLHKISHNSKAAIPIVATMFNFDTQDYAAIFAPSNTLELETTLRTGEKPLTIAFPPSITYFYLAKVIPHLPMLAN
jgi:hypothetical protein